MAQLMELEGVSSDGIDGWIIGLAERLKQGSLSIACHQLTTALLAAVDAQHVRAGLLTSCYKLSNWFGYQPYRELLWMPASDGLQ